MSIVTSAPAGRRADACDTLDDLAHEHFDRVVANTSLPARAARPATAPPALSTTVTERLRSRGVETLWSHQAAAVDALRAGRNVVVATGTASGKSLCYQLPIVDSIVAGSRDTTLLVFPTKALAQDQLRSFREWLVPDVVAATYDGDTPTDERAWIRTHANVVLTNPEMLHQGILPYHRRWATFLMRLRLIVVDTTVPGRNIGQIEHHQPLVVARRVRGREHGGVRLVRSRSDGRCGPR